MGHETSVDVQDVKWFAGYGPVEVVGPCLHADCPHNATSVIAWGPSLKHYELVTCDVPEGCNGRCRVWESALPNSNGGIPNLPNRGSNQDRPDRPYVLHREWMQVVP